MNNAVAQSPVIRSFPQKSAKPSESQQIRPKADSVNTTRNVLSMMQSRSPSQSQMSSSSPFTSSTACSTASVLRSPSITIAKSAGMAKMRWFLHPPSTEKKQPESQNKSLNITALVAAKPLSRPQPTFQSFGSISTTNTTNTIHTIDKTNSKSLSSRTSTPSTEAAALTPTEYARSLLQHILTPQARDKFAYTAPEDTLLDAYKVDVVNAVRQSDLTALQALLDQGRSFDACNRNGESLLHLACRCSDASIVRFLLERGVNVNVIDSVGRSVLHDVCWRHKLDMDLMLLFVGRIDPVLFVLKDNRGHTCFDYCRKEHYSLWTDFLKAHANDILASSGPAIGKRDFDAHDSYSSDIAGDVDAAEPLKKKSNSSSNLFQLAIEQEDLVKVKAVPDDVQSNPLHTSIELEVAAGLTLLQKNYPSTLVNSASKLVPLSQRSKEDFTRHTPSNVNVSYELSSSSEESKISE